MKMRTLATVANQGDAPMVQKQVRNQQRSKLQPRTLRLNGRKKGLSSPAAGRSVSLRGKEGCSLDADHLMNLNFFARCAFAELSRKDQ